MRKEIFSLILTIRHYKIKEEIMKVKEIES